MFEPMMKTVDAEVARILEACLEGRELSEADAERLLKDLESLPTDLRHVATIVNLGLCMVVGMIRHGCLQNGLEAIDDIHRRMPNPCP